MGDTATFAIECVYPRELVSYTETRNSYLYSRTLPCIIERMNREKSL